MNFGFTFRPHGKWTAPIVGVVAVVIVVVLLAVDTGPELSHAAPSATALAVMDRSFSVRERRQLRDQPASACVVGTSMATRRLGRGESEAYVQMVCAGCPIPDSTAPDLPTSEVVPAVFRLRSQRVVSITAVDAVGDPGFFDEIKADFPRQLWNAAASQVLPSRGQPAVRDALRAAHCPHRRGVT